MQIYDEETNEYGEPLEQVGGIICNLEYWDCECANDFIHHITVARCYRCGADYDESPPSRENEIAELRANSSD